MISLLVDRSSCACCCVWRGRHIGGSDSLVRLGSRRLVHGVPVSHVPAGFSFLLLGAAPLFRSEAGSESACNLEVAVWGDKTRKRGAGSATMTKNEKKNETTSNMRGRGLRWRHAATTAEENGRTPSRETIPQPRS